MARILHTHTGDTTQQVERAHTRDETFQRDSIDEALVVVGTERLKWLVVERREHRFVSERGIGEGRRASFVGSG